MRIGELSRRTGFSRDAIRFYERQGLIAAQENREETNNYKSYPEDAVMTLEVVRDAQAAGLSIGDLAIFLSQLAAEDAEDFLKEEEEVLALPEGGEEVVARTPGDRPLDALRRHHLR